jgi:hypothetical protein
MNPDDILAQMITTMGVVNGGTLGTLASGTAGITNSNITGSTISAAKPLEKHIEDTLEKWVMNKVVVEHKLQEQEFMKLRDTVPTFADEIKENLSKTMSREILKKATFTKKHNKDTDVHHFIGRVWTFTEDELKQLIEEVRNAS